MKKLILFSAVAALASLAISVRAVPDGYESVNFKATIGIQYSDMTKTVSLNNKDLLYLIGQEYGMSIPDGAKLVSYGLADREFAVLNSDNSSYIDNASHNTLTTDYYKLYPFANDSDNNDCDSNDCDCCCDDCYYTSDRVNLSDLYHYTDNSTGLYYRDATKTYSLDFRGLGKIKVDYDSYKESYNFNGVGKCYLPSLDLKGFGMTGLVIGSLSGSGKVDYPFDP